jgi:hypothetical protein
MTLPNIKLTIRCANQANEDLKIDEAKSDWTVRQLKIYLSNVHPSKPAPERQRIVFAGQLLRDEARLNDYFQRYDNADASAVGKSSEPYVLHLVYTASVEDSVAAAQRRQAANKETEIRQRKAATSTTTSPPIIEQPNLSSSPNVANSSYSPTYWPWMAAGQQQMAMGGAAPDVANDWIRQQQQMHAAMNMMMSQWYGQYMQAAYGAPAGFFPVQQPYGQQANIGFGNIGGGQQQPGQLAEPIGQQLEAPRAQVPQQQAMNAQGGLAPADDEDDPRNRDWLDYIYMTCRAGLLLMILYFYSSIERFIFVVLCCTLMYGLQAGWFGRRGQQQQNEQPPRNVGAVQVAPQVVQNAQVPPLNNQAIDGGAAGGGDERPEGVQEVQDRPTPPRNVEPPEMAMTAWNVFWTTCWTFISSFFASLVPERPPPLNM